MASSQSPNHRWQCWFQFECTTVCNRSTAGWMWSQRNNGADMRPVEPTSNERRRRQRRYPNQFIRFKWTEFQWKGQFHGIWNWLCTLLNQCMPILIWFFGSCQLVRVKNSALGIAWKVVDINTRLTKDIWSNQIFCTNLTSWILWKRQSVDNWK